MENKSKEQYRGVKDYPEKQARYRGFWLLVDIEKYIKKYFKEKQK